MKLLRYGPLGKEKPGIIDEEGNIRSLSDIVSDISGATLSSDNLKRLRALDLSSLPIVDANVRLGACVGNVGKFLCIGLNYADHAAESGMTIPDEPEVFTKATSAISGPNDDIIKPRNSDKLDWEVELAIVIGKHTSYVSEEDAHKYIAGYCVCNDVSERTFQLEKGSQWDKGKGCDTFGPIGPWLVTSDEIKYPNNLSMWLEVNGKTFQNGNTKTMVFKPEYIVSYLSQFMSLQPGDIISTGTPPGVGLGQNPPLYLNPGDKIKLGIEGLGNQQQVVISHS
ncbi:fumarylacetoacetate hydrolase family protein [Paraglaciecola psychrophila]|jgi:2,4-diketo-3-deoxy-L-fuconate hydrolase|uniref:Putative fumarylacetoacetate hydrolase family protein n=1 Tax=Paraglaciecola psychrophila 170 TaxID=1129794 RepID=K6ZPX9_9ALTE|nr:fumarylacetoacetate hydrolase family protein [Paraglaciecola psychrophila]AGH44463.1 putative fumarylacetoacetate hydrolase family protein [Paraglaciecola psychrophila 170]GAC38011.1 ureidoglycolate lyase [Paraglaciecola psychrophila 170]